MLYSPWIDAARRMDGEAEKAWKLDSRSSMINRCGRALCLPASSEAPTYTRLGFAAAVAAAELESSVWYATGNCAAGSASY